MPRAIFRRIRGEENARIRALGPTGRPMKVALIQAPVWWTLDPPLGLAQAAGCAKAAGHDVLVCDLNMLLWKERPKAYESLWIWEQFHHWNDPGFVERLFAEQASVVERELARIVDSGCRV